MASQDLRLPPGTDYRPLIWSIALTLQSWYYALGRLHGSEVVEAAAESLFKAWNRYPRKARGVRHPFQAILRLTLLGLVSGQTMAHIALFGQLHWQTLKEPLGFIRDRAPHATTISRALAGVPFSNCTALIGWVEGMVEDRRIPVEGLGRRRRESPWDGECPGPWKLQNGEAVPEGVATQFEQRSLSLAISGFLPCRVSRSSRGRDTAALGRRSISRLYPGGTGVPGARQAAMR